MRTYLALFLVSALFALMLTPPVRWLGQRLRAYGNPHQGGKCRLIPRLGGLAVVAASLAAWALLWLVPNDVGARLQAEWPTLAGLLIPAVLVVFSGVYDDLVGATPWQKIAVQILAAGVVWWTGFRIFHLPLVGYAIQSSLLSFSLTVLWIVLVTNSFNLIDGLDGLAAGTGFFVTISVFVVSLIQGNHFACILAITLAGALLGFLKFNSAPAQIFLGDTGSLFLGFFLGSLAIHTSQKSSTLLAIVVPFVAFGLPLMDTALAVVRRFLSGKPIFAADLNHTHHRLLQKGFSPRRVVLGLYGLAALFSLGSLLILRSTGNLVALVVVLVGVSAWFLTSQLQYEELSEFNVYLSQAIPSQRRVLANHILIRKASRQLEESPDLEQSWQLLAKVLDALDFEGVTCELSGWDNGARVVLPAWQRPGGGQIRDCWTVTIPLRAGDKILGQLRLQRAPQKGYLLFQFSSLADTLIPSFEKQLRRRYHAEETTAAVQCTVRLDPAFQPYLLANGRKEG